MSAALVLADFSLLVPLVVTATTTTQDLKFSVSAGERIVARVVGTCVGLTDYQSHLKRVVAVVVAIANERPLGEFDDILALFAAHLVAQRQGLELAIDLDNDRFRQFFYSVSTSAGAVDAFEAWLATMTAGPSATTADNGAQPQLPFVDDLQAALVHPHEWNEAWPEFSSEPVRAYVALPLTGLDRASLDQLAELSDLVAASLSEHGVAVHQPHLYTNPLDHGGYSGREIHDIDTRQTMDSDLVVALAVASSWGGGKELAYSERYSALQLILVPSGSSGSRLVVGTTADIEVATFVASDDLAAIIADYVARRRSDLEARRDARVHRPQRHQATLERLSHALAHASPGQLADMIVSSDRLDELVQSPNHLAGASLDEFSLVVEALGTTPSEVFGGGSSPSGLALGERELVALQDAADAHGWAAVRALELARAATGLLQASGQRRRRFLSIEDWFEFSREVPE